MNLVVSALFVIFFCGAAAATVGQEGAVVEDIDRIHQGDLVEIDVVGSLEFDWRGRLDPDGYLEGFERLPERVYGRCLSPGELSRAVSKAFENILREPTVEVRILDRSGRALSYIDGAVRNPLRLSIRRQVRLNELIVLTGGFTDTIGDEISLFRPVGAACLGRPASGGDPLTKTIKIREILEGAEGSNPLILPGDIVTVLKSMPVYVIGGVGTPQRLSARQGMTLSRAIDSAGGLSKSAGADRITVYRREGNETKATNHDLEKIRSGEAVDPKLEANDIVEVPMKGDPPRKLAPVVDVRGDGERPMALRVVD